MAQTELTPEQLAILTVEERVGWELAQKATRGPLTYDGVCLTNWRDDCTFEMEWLPNTPYDNEDADGEFFAHAREGYPEALRTIAELREKLAALQEALDNIGHVLYPGHPEDEVSAELDFGAGGVVSTIAYRQNRLAAWEQWAATVTTHSRDCKGMPELAFCSCGWNWDIVCGCTNRVKEIQLAVPCNCYLSRKP